MPLYFGYSDKQASESDMNITRNFANTIDASHTVVPKCLELGSYNNTDNTKSEN